MPPTRRRSITLARSGLVELIVTLGYFGMIAFPLNAFEMEMTAEQKGLRKPFEPLRVDESSAANPAASVSAPFVRSAAGALSQRLSRITAQADMPVEHRHYFDRIIRSRGRVCGPFQVLLHSPDVAERVAAVGEPILYDTLLPPPAKALTWLITAREFDCDYEWALSEHAAQRLESRTRWSARSGAGSRSPALTMNNRCSPIFAISCCAATITCAMRPIALPSRSSGCRGPCEWRQPSDTLQCMQWC